MLRVDSISIQNAIRRYSLWEIIIVAGGKSNGDTQSNQVNLHKERYVMLLL